ncbi:MAG: transporter [Xanthobacteraceae bacterium]
MRRSRYTKDLLVCLFRCWSDRPSTRWVRWAAALAFAAFAWPTNIALADEGGVSFWLPGIYGSLAAAPQQPGWSFAGVNYFDSVSASGSIAAAREVTVGRFNPAVNVNLNVNVNANLDLELLVPSYVFATPVFGGQLAVGVMGIVGRNTTGLNGTITAGVGPFTVTRSGSISDTVISYGDLYPQASLRWNSGVNNFMIYGTGDIPVGDYSATQLANLGIGHGAVDGGVGYTYFDPTKGHEFSFVTGLTYNLTNPSTNYQNGIDWHLDWGASQFLSKQFFVGAVGYFYDQLTADSGSAPILGPVESRVGGVGPQVGFIFPMGPTQMFLGLKAYSEFDGHDRPSGYSAWVTLAFSPSGAPPPQVQSPPMVTKAAIQ